MKKAASILIILMIIFAAQCVFAVVKVVNHTATIIDGKEQSSGDTTTYYTEDKLRMEAPNGMITIVRLDKAAIWSLDPNTKTYTEQTVEQMIEQMKNIPKGMMDIELDVEKTDEKKKIGKYNCRKIIISMKMMGMPTETEIWATKDIEVDSVMLKFTENAQKVFEEVPMLKQTYGMFEEVFDLKAYPVETVTEMNVFGRMTKNSSTLKSISEEKLDDSLFEIPEGYSKSKMPGFGGGK